MIVIDSKKQAEYPRLAQNLFIFDSLASSEFN